jgi:hypothetical protein
VKRAILYFLAAGEMTKHILCQGGIFLHHINPHILLLPQIRRAQHTQSQNLQTIRVPTRCPSHVAMGDYSRSAGAKARSEYAWSGS